LNGRICIPAVNLQRYTIVTVSFWFHTKYRSKPLHPKEYELMFHVERKHWWYLGMQSITEALLKSRYPNRRGLDILDAGCGTGSAMTGYLANYGTVTGVDISPLALDFCRVRGATRLGRASVLHLPFADASFDLLTSFDVLYEDSVSDDGSALKEFFRVLRPGGRLFLRLPAYDWLRGRHDRVIHTARRYYRKQVVSMLQANNLEVELASHANMFLFPIALLKRMFDQLFQNRPPASDLEFPAGLLNRLLRNILAMEAPLIEKYHLSFGLSVITIAKKK
jgi:ubiquinone/menaquinone biosynthesis C-methylase UbiE